MDLYNEDHDPERSVVCFDETSRQLIENARPPHWEKTRTGSTL